MSEQRAGVIVRIAEDEPRFVPAELARRILSAPRITWLPGFPASVLVSDGRVVDAVKVASFGSAAVVCEVDGAPVALTGVEADRAGWFEASGAGVLLDGREVPELDVRSAVSEARSWVESARSAAREQLS